MLLLLVAELQRLGRTVRCSEARVFGLSIEQLTFRLSDARAAVKAWFKSLGADLAPYSYGSNSCVTCCVSALRAGGRCPPRRPRWSCETRAYDEGDRGLMLDGEEHWNAPLAEILLSRKIGTLHVKLVGGPELGHCTAGHGRVQQPTDLHA